MVRYAYEETEIWLDTYAPDPNRTGESVAPKSRFADLPEPAFTVEDLLQQKLKVYPYFMGEFQLSLGYEHVIMVTASHPPRGLSTSVAGTKISSNTMSDLAIFKAPGTDSGSFAPNWLLSEEERARSNASYKNHLARSNWDEIIVPITIQERGQPCPFVFPDDKCPYLETGTIEGEERRGQFMGCVSKIFQYQHRIFLFSIYIDREWVYLIRWDRAGAVVAEPFNLFTDRVYLHTFLSRLTKMSRAQQGFDDTISPATPDIVKELMDLDPEDSTQKRYLNEARAADGGVPAAIFQVEMERFAELGTLRLAFARPHAVGGGILGRATRGYIAYDIDNKQLNFLKDYWQPVSKSYHPELETYTKLSQAGVERIATPLGGGKLELQKTITQEYLPRSQNDADRARVHYRFAVKEIGRPLEDYDEPIEMLLAVLCAIIAHSQAWKCGVLHRDISPGNILILGHGVNARGILNDWDMCKHEDDGTSSDFRSGTWIFMSAPLLKFPKRVHQLSDDIESFVHVINWLILRFHINWEGHTGLERAVDFYEEHARTVDGDIGEDVNSPVLQDLASSLALMCKDHYLSPDVAQLLKPKFVEQSQPSSRPSNNIIKTRMLEIMGRKPSVVPSAPLVPVKPTEPLMDSHGKIMACFASALGRLEEEPQGCKLKDQLLHLPSAQGTPVGGSARLRQSSKKGSQAGSLDASLNSAAASGTSSTGSRRSTRLTKRSNEIEDAEAQPTPKTSNTGRGKRPSNIAEEAKTWL